jgi:hypothetical protein
MLEFAEKWAVGKATPKQIAVLADDYIDVPTATIVAEQFAKHGVKDRGVWWANTEAWDNTPAVQAAGAKFRRGLAREVDRTIVTPGQDKPLWASGGSPILGQLGPVMFQFKSFQVASVQRTLLAGLQQRDAAVLNGVILSLGLGALVYYVKSAIGGYEVSSNPAKWATEAVDRSGLLGWTMDINNFTEKVTGGRIGMAALTGEVASRYAARNALGATLGPSFDALGTALQVAGAPFKESGWSGTDTHAVRQLIPLQNLFYIRWLFDQAETGTNRALGIPERRRSLRVQ